MSTHRVHLRRELIALVDRIPELALTLVSAPAGSGKTTLLSHWRDLSQARGHATAWIDLAPLHADPGWFLEELAAELSRVAPAEAGRDGFGSALLRRLPHVEAPDPHALALLLARELRELAEPVMVFLDNYQRLPAGSPVDTMLSHVLRDGVPHLHLVLATRGARPGAAARLLTEGRALELHPDDLSLRSDQIERILQDRGVALDGATLPKLLAQTAGWATGVLLAVRALAEGRAGDPDRFISELSTHDDLFSYVASELLEGEDEAMLSLLECAALPGPTPGRVLEEMVGDQAPRLLDEALAKGLLLHDQRRVGLHPLWEALLRERMRRRLSPAELGRAVGRTVQVLEEAGEAERAIELCIELAQREPAVGLIERHGLDWIERGHHENVSRWPALSRDPNDRRAGRVPASPPTTRNVEDPFATPRAW